MTGASLAPEVARLLAPTDARIDAAAPRRETLCPERARAHTLAQVAQRQLDGRDDAVALTFAAGLSRLATAQLDAFPENLFWDFDYPAKCAWEQALEAADPSQALFEHFGLMAELQRLYGADTVIRFRYVHDFIYGYDWVKWVRREPAQDGSVGPFDLEFLRYMERRAHELVALIEADDAKYPRLRDPRPRNPFPFSREPDDERRLLGALAARGEVPVEAWRGDADPVWDRPYAELREAHARVLGLALPR